jgi:hypothetical protein
VLSLPLLGRMARALAVRRALRSSAATFGNGRRRSPLHRSSRPPLPEPLRGRLLAIPATVPRRTPTPITPRSTAGGGLSWLLASPVAPLAASFVLALALSLAWGNPYQAGAATLDRVRDQATPATSRILIGASTLASVAADLGETAIGALPRAGLRASRTVSALLGERALPSERLDDDP